MEFNEITFGNPTQQQLEAIKQIGLVDDLFEELSQEAFPLNDSEGVKYELNEIVDDLATMADHENEEYLRRYQSYDKNLIQTIVSTFKNKGIETEDLSLEIINDIQSLILKLKYHYQRPRPRQLANYLKLKLFPYKSATADTPSFPSGHTVQATTILTVIGNKYPSHYAFCKEMIEDIAYSRIYLGLHYASDNDFAKKVAKAILKSPKFTKKYEI